MIRVRRYIAVLAIALLMVGISQGAVLGIDFGSDTYKISMIKPGRSFTMVENEYTKTNTYTGVTFFDNQRFFEFDAETKASRIPQNAFHHLLKFLGKSKDDQELQNLIASQHQNNIIEKQEGNSIYFKLEDFKLPTAGSKGDLPERLAHDSTLLNFEEILSMVFSHAKQISDKFGEIKFSDVVITTAPWWGLKEKETLYVCARLAGFNPIGFISENTGAALYMGIERKPEDEDTTILFYNMGAQSTKVSVVKFTNRENPDSKKKETLVKVLGEAWDDTLGGYSLDWCVAEMFAKDFDAKYSTNIMENYRVMRRLLKEANKSKEVLSANKEVTMMVEEVFNDKDHHLKITRETFETTCGDIFLRVKAPIEEALTKTGLSTKDINAIEIIGGSVRVPKVQELIKEATGIDASMHLNGDDSMALGASFIAANRTSTFKVKNIYLEHGIDHNITVTVHDPSSVGTENEFKKSATIFPIGTLLSTRKKINIPHAKDLVVDIEVPATSGTSKIRYLIEGVNQKMEDLNEGQTNFRISLGFSLDYLGNPFVHKASLVYDKEIEIEPTTNSTTKEDEVTKQTKTKTFAKDLTVKLSDEGSTQHRYLSNPELIKESKAILEAFSNYEIYIRKNAEAKNKLESLIYKSQEILDDESIAKYATEEEKVAIKQKGEETDDWLFSDDAQGADFEIFNSKLKEFNKLILKVTHRKEEDDRRPKLLSEAHNKIDEIESTISSMNKTRPWLTAEQIQDALNELEVNRKFLEEKIVEQNAREPSLEPVITAADIKMRVKSTQEIVYNLRKIQKPKEEKKEGEKDSNSTETIIPDLKEGQDIDPKILEEIKKKFENKKKDEDDMQELLKRVIDGDESAKELLAQKMKAKSDKEKTPEGEESTPIDL